MSDQSSQQTILAARRSASLVPAVSRALNAITDGHSAWVGLSTADLETLIGLVEGASTTDRAQNFEAEADLSDAMVRYLKTKLEAA